MKSEVTKSDQFTAVITLEIDAEHASVEYSKAIKRIGQRVNIPGFRRGRAPRQVIEKTVGIDRIKQEVADRILPHAFADVISEHQLDIIAPPEITEFKFDVGQIMLVKASAELRPEVALPELSSIKVDVPEFKAPEGQYEEEFNSIVERMTTLETVIDRASEKTDVVNIDFAGAINGELIRGGAAKSYLLDLANNNFIEGFADKVVGHKIGEEFTIQVPFPQEYHDATLSGKLADFTIKINEIKRKVVPELTDELAKKCGPYDSLAHLEAEVKQFIQLNVDSENDFRKQKAVIDTVVDMVKIEVPDSMINREAKVLMNEVQNRMKNQGVNWEQFIDSQGQEKVWENLRQEAAKRVKTSLTFSAIAKQEAMTVTAEEFQAEVLELSKDRGIEDKIALKQLANSPEAVQALTDQILSAKVVEFLLSRSELTFVEDKSEEASQAAEALKDASTLQKEEYEVMAD
jgi:trigger factor